MARVKDLWFTADRQKTARHPDRGGNKDAKRWLACWEDPDGREKTRAFGKQSDAKTYASRWKPTPCAASTSTRRRGMSYSAPSPRNGSGCPTSAARPGSEYESAYRNQVKPKFANRRLKAVKPSDVLDG